MDRAADNHYPTQSFDAIAALKVPAALDSVLFLWVTVPFERLGHDLLSLWGFEYRSQLVWVKDRLGTGYWFRNLHEHTCLSVCAVTSRLLCPARRRLP